jgi:GTP-binding protein
LGLGEPVGISAAHGDGMHEVAERLQAIYEADTPQTVDDQDPADEAEIAEAEDTDEEDPTARPIHIAIVGRPNVGKSTLLNALLNEERAVTSPIAGTTRDAIAVRWQSQGRNFRLVDTAGLRRKAQVDDHLEKLSLEDTFRAIRLAHVVILVIDANNPMENQDLQIARLIEQEGRAMILAVNKWDSVPHKKREGILGLVEERLEASLPQWRGLRLLSISALEKQRLPALITQVIEAYEAWNIRISTAKLNGWLFDMTVAHPPPLTASRRPNKLKYMTQFKARPPSFLLSLSQPDELPESYLRYLGNNLRHDFALQGVPLRFKMRSSINPFAAKARGAKRDKS